MVIHPQKERTKERKNYYNLSLKPTAIGHYKPLSLPIPYPFAYPFIKVFVNSFIKGY